MTASKRLSGVRTFKYAGTHKARQALGRAPALNMDGGRRNPVTSSVCQWQGGGFFRLPTNLIEGEGSPAFNHVSWHGVHLGTGP